MNARIIRASFFALALLLTGAGCFGGGSDVEAVYGVWRSVDGGITWEQMNALPTSRGVASIRGVEVHELVQDPSDKDALYIGSISSGMLYSYAAGDGWFQVKEPFLREGRVRGIAIDPSNKCVVYASRGQVLAKSVDCGRTFDIEAYVDPRQDVVITDVEVDWFNPNVVYLTNTAGEVLRSSDAALTWQTVYREGGFFRDLEIDKSDSRILYAASARRGLYRSADGGNSWEVVIDDGYQELDGIDNIKEVDQTATGSDIWISTDHGILRSRDHGITWEDIPLITGDAGADITAIAVDPRDGDHLIYVAGSTIYSTINGGNVWETEKMPQPARAFQLLIDPADSSRVYMGLRPYEEEATFF